MGKLFIHTIKNVNFLLRKHNKSYKFFPNSELKVKTYEIFRPYFDRTSSVNDMNVKKMNFKKVFFNASWGLELCHR